MSAVTGLVLKVMILAQTLNKISHLKVKPEYTVVTTTVLKIKLDELTFVARSYDKSVT